MIHAFVFIVLLLASALPALAQQGGLPALQAQVTALQAQNSGLQQQLTTLQASITNLQTQINNLPLPPADDGTAQALVGTWTGSASSVEFDRAVKFTSPTSPPSPPEYAQFFNIFGGVPPGLVSAFAVPIIGPCFGGSGTCQTGNMMVGINPEFWVVRGNTDSITFVLNRDGMKLSGTVVNQDNQDNATLTGLALANNFFLLRARIPATGPCAANGFIVFQGTGTLSADRTRLTVTGSGVDESCQHTVFRIALAK